MPYAPTEFTPIASLIGGGLIGLSAVLLMRLHGRIAGISSISLRMFPPFSDREGPVGAIAFIAGLVIAPLLYAVVTGARPPVTIEAGMLALVAGGFLAGFGAILGNGCTSGHGVCGLSRLSLRSLVATLVFMTTAAITVFIIRHGVN